MLKEKATSGKDLAVALAQDKKFRKELISALGHRKIARRRAARRIVPIAAVSQLASDQRLLRELRNMTDGLQRAVVRAEKKSSHGLRNSLILVGAGGAIAVALPQSRRWLSRLAGRGSSTRTVSESIEVGVPVSAAYNQWTQFEDFPIFMEGVDHVQQLDDTRLHWVTRIGGGTAEWDAKILEQHPDRQISWVSEDGNEAHGTVTFEPLGDSRTLVRLSMSDQAEGPPLDAVGSPAGLVARRVRGDLERFKELVEARRAETGAWHDEVTTGTTER